MRLNVPPTLKPSSLIDSHSLSVGSPVYLNSRGFKKSSKVFKEDDNMEIGDDMTIENMIMTNSKKQTANLLPPEFLASMQKKKSFDFEEDIRTSEAQFLKKMPLFNQFEEESNLSQIKLSEIPKKQLNYQDQFNEQQQELPTPRPNRLKRNTSSGDLQASVDISSQVLTKGLKRLKNIDIINEESSSSPGNSLNGSRNHQQKNQLVSSLRKTNSRTSQQAFQLEPIQQVNRQKHGIAESSSSHSKTYESSSRITRQIEQIKNSHIIKMSEFQSERQLNQSNPSDKSSQTIHLKDEYDEKSEFKSSKDNRSKQKMRETQKLFKLKNEDSIWDQTEAYLPQINTLRNQVNRSPGGVQLEDSDKRLLSNVNERYQRIKDMKNRKSQTSQSSKHQSAKKVTFQTDHMSSSQKSTQTEGPSNHINIPESSVKQVHKRYAEQIQLLQRENSRLHKQTNMNTDTITHLQGMKTKYEEENKFLTEKIKRLERILQKNEKELTEWKEFAKEGRVEPTQTTKETRVIKEMNIEWRQKEDRYLARITELQKQLYQANLLLRDSNKKPSSNNQDMVTHFKHDHKYRQHIDKLHHYQQNLKRNMQIIRNQQQKIIQEWRLIDQYHTSTRQPPPDHKHEKYQFKTVQREQPPVNYVNTVVFRQSEDRYARDNDVASISAKLKQMRSQLAKNSR